MPVHEVWRGGFSLIELLVVIAVMSILMALLLPALMNAKRTAHSIRCMNDQRTVSTAMQYYSQENDDYILPYYGPGYTYVAGGWAAWWYMLLLDGAYTNYGMTVVGGNYIKMSTAKVIMLDMPPAKNRVFPSYADIGYGMFTKGYSAPRKMPQIVKPSRSIWLGDSATKTDYTYYNDWRSVCCNSWMALHYRHPGMTANVSFPDGHAAGIKPDAQNEPDYWSLWTDMP